MKQERDSGSLGCQTVAAGGVVSKEDQRKLATKAICMFCVTSALASTGAFAQGTIGFTNTYASKVQLATSEDGSFLIDCPKGGGMVSLCWAPAGTPYTPWSGSTMAYWLAQNPGWAAVPAACGMNAPSAGRFNGGTMTLPTSTPGATVDCVIFGWTGTYSSFDEALFGNAMPGVSEKFTVTTGNPLATPPDAPAAMTSFKGVILAPGGLIPGQTADGFTYRYYGSGAGSVIITGYRGPLQSIAIPSTIPGVGTVTSFGVQAFENHTNLTSIILPDSVTSYWARTFANCTGLTSITIPDSVTSFSQGTFDSCTGLTNVTIGKSVTSFGGSTFAHCTGLTSITIPDSVTSFGDGAFDSCTGLTNVTIGKSVTNIGDHAFVRCGGLRSVTIPYSVTNIRCGAFAFCTNLTSACFQGNAPDLGSCSSSVFDTTAAGFTIYYPVTAVGWTTPAWQGGPAQPYQPMLSLVRGPGTVEPLFNGLRLSTNYQLQVSADLKTWSDSGLPFTATNTSGNYSEAFDVGNRGQLFFRLKSVP
jgi:hypothetical protein